MFEDVVVMFSSLDLILDLGLFGDDEVVCLLVFRFVKFVLNLRYA